MIGLLKVTDLSKYEIDIENRTNTTSLRLHSNIRLSCLSLHSIGNAELHKFFVVIDIWPIFERDWSVMICTDIQITLSWFGSSISLTKDIKNDNTNNASDSLTSTPTTNNFKTIQRHRSTMTTPLSVKERIAALQKKNSNSGNSTIATITIPIIQTQTRAFPNNHNVHSVQSRSRIIQPVIPIPIPMPMSNQEPQAPSSHNTTRRGIVNDRPVPAPAPAPVSMIETKPSVMTKPNPSRSKVAALAQNMKGLNMQAMLSGAGYGNKTPWKTQTTEEISDASVDKCSSRPFERAVIGRGRRRPRSIPTLQTIKLSTETE